MDLITKLNEYNFENEQLERYYKIQKQKLKDNIYKIINENKENITQKFIDIYYWESDLRAECLSNIINNKPIDNIKGNCKKLYKNVTPYKEITFCKNCDKEIINIIYSKYQLINKYNKQNINKDICDECKLNKEKIIQEKIYAFYKTDQQKQKNKKEEIQQLKNMPYKEYLQSEHWKELRNKKLKQANYKCQLCNSNEKLNVHHKTYENRGNFYKEINDLIVLCRCCHSKFHDKLEDNEYE